MTVASGEVFATLLDVFRGSVGEFWRICEGFAGNLCGICDESKRSAVNLRVSRICGDGDVMLFL